MVFEGIVAEERYRFLTDGLASAILFAIIHGRHVGSAETQSRKVWRLKLNSRARFGARSELLRQPLRLCVSNTNLARVA